MNESLLTVPYKLKGRSFFKKYNINKKDGIEIKKQYKVLTVENSKVSLKLIIHCNITYVRHRGAPL